MATNENTIGVRADFIMADFDRHVKGYNASLANANKKTDEFYKAQEKAARESSQKQSASLQQLRQNFISYAAEVTAIVGTLVIAYKTLSDAASFLAMIISGNDLATSYGVNFQAILDGLDEVSRGTLSMEQRVLIANRSLIAGGANFANKIPQLYKIAAAAARATGQDIGYVFETLTKGIAKGSPLLIDNAELYLKIGGAVDEYAASLGKSGDELTAQERQQAVLNAVLDQGTELVQRIGENAVEATLGFRQMDAATADFKETLGLAVNEILDAGGAIGGLASGFDALSQIVAISAGGVVGGITLITTFLDRLRNVQKDAIGLPSFSPADIGKWIADAQREANKAFGQTVLAVSGISQTNEAARAAGAQQTALEKARADAATELQKRSEDLAKYNDKIQDLQIKAGESILDAEQDFQDKSAKAWNDYIKKTNDIIAEGISARAKIQQTYNDKIASAEHDYQRGIEDANYSHGQKLASIERDYQDTIRGIQQTYQEDALDAVRNLDAIGLLRAKERRDKDLANAAQNRDRAMSDEQENYARALYELTRALADKRDEADENRRRDLEEQRQNERDKLDAAKQAYNDQQTEAQNAFDARIATIRAQYNQEDIEAQAHYLHQEELLRAHLQAMQALMAAYGIGGGDVTSPVRKPRGGGNRADGGVDIVNTPTQFTAGERGPEMAMFIPLNRALPSPVSQTVNHVGDFSHDISGMIQSNMAGH